MNPHALTQKTVVAFAKNGPAIYHSHHDMLRFWERAIKRADLPVRMTQGFNPRPRIIFPHALGLGIASACEQIEIELHDHIDNNALLDKIKAAAGDTLGILGAFDLPPSKRSRQIISTSYEITGWPDTIDAPALQDAIARLLALPTIDVTRGAPGKERSLDVRPYVDSLTVGPEAANMETVETETAGPDCVVSLRLSHNSTGTARPDEIVSCLTEMLGIEKYALAIRKTAMKLTEPPVPGDR